MNLENKSKKYLHFESVPRYHVIAGVILFAQERRGLMSLPFLTMFTHEMDYARCVQKDVE